jgi:hypothetical protein
MKEISGDVFSVPIINFADAICITTNSVIKNNGRVVMGAGCALSAKNKFKDIDLKLGNLIKENGHIVQIIIWEPKPIISFPTKVNYWENSRSSLIELSIEQLINLTNQMKWEKVVLPRPGCSNGGLNWISQIKPLIEKKLDDRFFVISK